MLRRIAGGESSPELVNGLDAIDTAGARRALDVVGGGAEIDPDAWRGLAVTPQETEPSGQDRLAALAAAVVAAARGDDGTANALEPVLADLAASDGWSALADVLRRIIGGERDPALVEGLDPTDTVVVSLVLSGLAGQPEPDPVKSDDDA